MFFLQNTHFRYILRYVPLTLLGFAPYFAWVCPFFCPLYFTFDPIWIVGHVLCTMKAVRQIIICCHSFLMRGSDFLPQPLYLGQSVSGHKSSLQAQKEDSRTGSHIVVSLGWFTLVQINHVTFCCNTSRVLHFPCDRPGGQTDAVQSNMV